jgi:hypothetical protein
MPILHVDTLPDKRPPASDTASCVICAACSSEEAGSHSLNWGQPFQQARVSEKESDAKLFQTLQVMYFLCARAICHGSMVRATWMSRFVPCVFYPKVHMHHAAASHKGAHMPVLNV